MGFFTCLCKLGGIGCKNVDQMSNQGDLRSSAKRGSRWSCCGVRERSLKTAEFVASAKQGEVVSL